MSVVSVVASFIQAIWSGMCDLDFFGFGFSFGAFFFCICVADISVWLIGRVVHHKSDNE